MRKNPNKYEIREIRGKFVRVFCAVPEIRGIPRILSRSRYGRDIFIVPLQEISHQNIIHFSEAWLTKVSVI
jgi:hypothetical protein